MILSPMRVGAFDLLQLARAPRGAARVRLVRIRAGIGTGRVLRHDRAQSLMITELVYHIKT